MVLARAAAPLTPSSIWSSASARGPRRSEPRLRWAISVTLWDAWTCPRVLVALPHRSRLSPSSRSHSSSSLSESGCRCSRPRSPSARPVDRRSTRHRQPVSIDVIGYLKGELGEAVTVRVPGGQVGDMVNIIPGAPTFGSGRSRHPVPQGQRPGSSPSSPDDAGRLSRHHGSPRGDLVVPPLVDAAEPGASARAIPAAARCRWPAFGAAVRAHRRPDDARLDVACWPWC